MTTRLWLTAWLLVPGSSLDVELLWDNNLQTDGENARALSPPAFPDIRVVDDIVVAESGWVITGYNYSAIEWPEWVHSGMSQVYLFEDVGARPSTDLLVQMTRPDRRLATGRRYHQLSEYLYFVDELEIVLAAGTYWIGVRDPGGSGEGSNYYMSSDGGPDGGCPPDYPHGTCRTGYVRFGNLPWGPEGEGYSHAFEIWGYEMCVGDVDGSRDVGFRDLLAVLSAWGSYGPCPPSATEDIDLDCEVGLSDLLLVLSHWGPCEPPRRLARGA